MEGKAEESVSIRIDWSPSVDDKYRSQVCCEDMLQVVASAPQLHALSQEAAARLLGLYVIPEACLCLLSRPPFIGGQSHQFLN